MNPELRHPANAAGAALAIIGGAGMFAILFDFPGWITAAGFILWLIGIGILASHTKKK